MPAKAERSVEIPTKPKPEKKKSKPKIVKQETPIDGVSLRVNKGSEINLPSETLERLLKLGLDVAIRDKAAEELTTEEDSLKEKIVNIAKKIPGLRGFISERQGYQITITEKKTRKANRIVVKSALPPETYSAIARETYKGELSIPAGLVNPEEVSKAIRNALTKLGISKEALPTIYTDETTLDIDMEYLDRLVDEDQITLPPEAIIEEVVWEVAPKILDPKLFT